MTEYRWPVRECLHYNVSFSITVRLVTGEVLGSLPVRCLDCGLEFED